MVFFQGHFCYYHAFVRETHLTYGGKPTGFDPSYPLHRRTQSRITFHRDTDRRDVSVCASRLHEVDNITRKLVSCLQVVEQWTGNPKAAGSIPAGRQLFRVACFE